MSELVIATFNVHHCEGLDKVVDIDRTAIAIRGTGAEVIALQELDAGRKRSGRADQAAVLGEALELNVFFHPTVVGSGGGLYGIGLATPSEVEITPVELPRLRPEDEPRAALVAALNGLTVVATHLSVKPDSRVAQFEALGELVHGIAGPVCLLGDLNQEPDPKGPLATAGLTGPRPPATFITARRHLDHILAGGGAAVQEVWAVRSKASDHLPLGGRVTY
jgi:endonuclease/exonuclease/phosphatase family metal-dependent hydrolase